MYLISYALQQEHNSTETNSYYRMYNSNKENLQRKKHTHNLQEKEEALSLCKEIVVVMDGLTTGDKNISIRWVIRVGFGFVYIWRAIERESERERER